MNTRPLLDPGILPDIACAAGYNAKEMASLCSLSPRQLRRVIRNLCGCSPQCLLEHLKIKKAQDDLKAHRLVKKTAIEVGFKHSSSFCEWFKRRTGLRPTEFVAQNENQNTNVRFS